MQQDLVLIQAAFSGIQEFIFNIKSKGASRVLKARSFFVSIITKLAKERFIVEFGKEAVELKEIGGGQFLLAIHRNQFSEEKLAKIIAQITTELKHQNIHFNCSHLNYDSALSLGKNRKLLKTQAAKEKYKRHLQTSNTAQAFQTLFTPSHHKQTEHETFSSFARKLKNAKGYTLTTTENVKKGITSDGVSYFGVQYQLNNDGTGNSFEGKTIADFPLWNQTLLHQYAPLLQEMADEDDEETDPPKNGNIIEYKYLAAFAQQRTGTARIAILKMDVDNLGTIFGALDDPKPLSEAMQRFFNAEFTQLNKQPFSCEQRAMDEKGKPIEVKQKGINHKKQPSTFTKFKIDTQTTYFYNTNISIVYAGGDDCFILGAWDAILSFAQLVQERFYKFQKELRTQIPQIKQDITLSAGIALGRTIR